MTPGQIALAIGDTLAIFCCGIVSISIGHHVWFGQFFDAGLIYVLFIVFAGFALRFRNAGNE